MGVGVMQTKNAVLLEQSAYTKALLSRFGMDKENSVATPVDVNADLVTTSDEVEDCDKDLYQSAVEDRYQDFDITCPYYQEGFGFVLKNPSPLPKWHGLINPLSATVWILFICATVTVIGVFTAIFYLLEERQPYDAAFLLVLAAVFCQSYPYKIKKTWVHLWLLLWWWPTFVLACAYTSNLVAYITIPVPPSRVETIQDLVASNLRILIQDYGTFLPEALSTSEDASQRNLASKIDLFPVEADSYVNLGFPKILAGTHAVVESYSYLFFKRYEADVQNFTYFMKEKLYSTYLTWLLPKNSPYTQIFSKELQRFVETGLVTKLYEEYMVKIPDRHENLCFTSTHPRLVFRCPCNPVSRLSNSELGRLVSESACEREDPGSNPAADMVDAAINTAWDLGKTTE
ncbi:Ionotropic glutamate receptor [Trinorchestia longiramus]|nr:Ionotropic glutamate receptor [Trinorchestia longiramus]